MKRFIFLLLSIIIALSFIVIIPHLSPLNELAKTNIKALAIVTPDPDKLCYETITSKPGVKVLYCPECRFLRGAPVSWSNTDECEEVHD